MSAETFTTRPRVERYAGRPAAWEMLVELGWPFWSLFHFTLALRLIGDAEKAADAVLRERGDA